MQRYMEAHEAFVNWLDGEAGCQPTPAEMERALLDLAKCAAHRGMSDVHWTFVVDGLVAHARRRCPGNPELSRSVARGFDLSLNWQAAKSAAHQTG